MARSKKENARECVFFIQSYLKEHGLEAVVLFNSDPHSSENLAPHFQGIAFISGFAAEAASMVITLDGAYLWTDSRYFIQATADLEGTGIELMKIGVEGVPSISEFVRGLKVAIDPILTSISDAKELSAAVRELVLLPGFIDNFWTSRPEHPCTEVEILPCEYAGLSHLEKLALIREKLAGRTLLVTALDEIAWTLNIRSKDIDYDPFTFAYLLITPSDTTLYINREIPLLEGVTPKYYGEIYRDIATLDSVMVDPATTNYYLYSLAKDAIIEKVSPIQLLKAVKNPVEIAHLRNAYLQDGIALTKFLYYVDTTTDELDEWTLSQKLDGFRAQIEGYKGNSFETISAYGPSAALPHYHTLSEGSRKIGRSGLYLVDSGGQYLFGTTDVTRTVPMGPVTELEKTDYTLVLKGMIDLSMAVFPRGTAGCQIDALAREPLWKAMRNFGHGTGHGIGFFLGCHEGPQGIRQNFNPQAMLPGMVTSNEPSLYREGMHGIRHENVLLCVDLGESEFGTFYGFETLTLAPIDPRPVDWSLLNAEEAEWLHSYNNKVYEALKPYLTEAEADWLSGLICA